MEFSEKQKDKRAKQRLQFEQSMFESFGDKIAQAIVQTAGAAYKRKEKMKPISVQSNLSSKVDSEDVSADSTPKPESKRGRGTRGARGRGRGGRNTKK